MWRVAALPRRCLRSGALLALPVAVLAQAPAPLPDDPALRIAALQAEVARLQEEVARLRADRSGPDWRQTNVPPPRAPVDSRVRPSPALGVALPSSPLQSQPFWLHALSLGVPVVGGALWIDCAQCAPCANPVAPGWGRAPP